MVIQRFQSLFLLMAFAMVTVFIFMPFGYSKILEADSGTLLHEWKPTEFAGLWIPSVIAALLYLVAIFQFKRMSLQKGLVWLAILATVAAIGVMVYILVAGFADLTPGFTVESDNWGGSGLLLVGALIGGFAAISRISADQRILRNVDRLR